MNNLLICIWQSAIVHTNGRCGALILNIACHRLVARNRVACSPQHSRHLAPAMTYALLSQPSDQASIVQHNMIYAAAVHQVPNSSIQFG